MSHFTPDQRPRTPSNRFGMDYRAEAARLGAPAIPIIDAHTHVMGTAAKVYDDARRAFGITRTYTMTQIHLARHVQETLGDSARFIAFHSFSDPDRAKSTRHGYLEVIERFHSEFGSRVVKLWRSPRLRDVIPDHANLAYGTTDVAEIDSEWSVRVCELGEKLGMMYMIHIADPDTWYAHKYNTPAKYGLKSQEYERLERMLDRFTNPWIAAHMGGWPENLPALDALLTRHPNLYIDTSATRWVVRELSKDPAASRAFFIKWRTRLMFGSDIVASDDHLTTHKKTGTPSADLADSPESAFDLYASRYWALRTMLETGYDGESNIADPDLPMIDPARHNHMSAPRLAGMALPKDVLIDLYHNVAENVVEKWCKEHR